MESPRVVETPQIQIQTRDQAQEEEWVRIPWEGFKEPEVRSWRNIEFVIYSWGSCRRSRVEIVLPQRVDLVRLSDEYGEYSIDLGFAVVEVVNSDSSRNMHRYIIFEKVRQDTVVYVYHSPSCNERRKSRRAYLLKPDGSAAEVPVKIRRVDVDAGVKRKTYAVYYAEYSGAEVELERELISEDIATEKLSIKVRKAGGKVIVEGDTYHVKDTLKSHGFRWDPREKAWYKEAADVNAIASALRSEGVNVEVVE